MLPQIKSLSMNYCLWLDDDEFPEMHQIRFEPVSLSECHSLKLVYDTGYGPESLWIIAHDSDEALLIDSDYSTCNLNLKNHSSDLSDDMMSYLDMDEDIADQIAVCLPSLLSGLKAAAGRRT
jgi:hypothetical protein